MFEKLRKRRRRRIMRLRNGKGTRRVSSIQALWRSPGMKIAGIVVAVAALAVLIIFVVVPLIGGLQSPQQTATAEVSATIEPTPSPIAKEDMSEGAEELVIDYNSVNDPYVYGSEVVFSTGTKTESSPELTTIAVFNIDTGETTEVPGITKANDSLFEPKIDDNYIVYLDCKSEYGGNVCGYDRASGEAFVMREYFYGKPKVTLVGNYALWMQQTANGIDKLYLYDLSSRESVVLEILEKTAFAASAPYMSADDIIFVEPEGETQVSDIERSSTSTNAEIRIIPVEEGGEQQSQLYLPGTYVYNPMIQGDDIVFMDGPGDDASQLMLCEKSGDTYSEPVVIATGVLNYCLGDGFVAYTNDDAVYIYYFADGSTGKLSSDTTRAMLASANGKEVVWYDMTGGADATGDVVIHITVP